MNALEIDMVTPVLVLFNGRFHITPPLMLRI
jgi:hypothetical protein